MMSLVLSPSENSIAQRVWKSLNLYVSIPTNHKNPQITLSYEQMQKLGHRVLSNCQSNNDQLGLVNHYFTHLIHILTIVINNLHDPQPSDSQLVARFAKINARIYDLDLVGFCEALIVSLHELVPVSVSEEIVMLKFLNQLLTYINECSADPVLELDDPRLSYSDSNLSSTFSLAHDIDDDQMDHINDVTILPNKGTTSNTIDIDSVENLDDHDNVTSSMTSDSTSDEDESYDYLNSFSSSATNSESKPQRLSLQKSRKRLSSLNLSKPSRRSSMSTLRTVSTTASTGTTNKQDCIIT
ncbi:hypothetical protein PSN45_001882 [Yamadazyma tenuis]|uniref:Uncharacterized protein n=1 Tax=Candida tenuis (strain ATCC 10573 / BCRC 21748 / CBS 615 / JCM 9827 / NBRC 10315 / NRRL Y-1498 / VKM Y-70) TaxID=590646 RepID=G3BDR0_CANTC|nr:uncharacterized protein CANTEDRAFT_95810 [Yamadazyma tenuis ATCC 10573]EGV60356.1 hypothetical protein CANTEDRAFT_95810 [Yamadazyma tenuis ATCC 10573]WEJ94398.1 hypothetical protein PSN45_001882 [Yamadazyma tenuis]